MTLSLLSLYGLLALFPSLLTNKHHVGHFFAASPSSHGCVSSDGREDDTKPVVIVVGAGLAGLALSLGLSKSCKYCVHLVEKRTNFLMQGATLGLAPNGMKALDELCPGVVDDMFKAGITFQPFEGWTTLMLPWWEIRDALLKRVQERTDVTIHMGLDIDSIEDNATSPSAKVRFRNSPKVLEGQLVVGADGVNSGVRRILGHKSALVTDTLSWIGNVDAAKKGSKLAFLLDKAYPDSITPLDVRTTCGLAFTTFSYYPRSGRLSWVLTAKGSLGQQVTDALDALQLLKDVVDDETWETLTNMREETNPENTLTLRLKVQDMSEDALKLLGEGWGGRGRVTLIGDAAHAMRPISGQGASMAFEDCAVLCRILTSGGTLESLCTHSLCEKNIVLRFEQERLKRVKVIHDDQRLKAEQLYKTGVRGEWSPEFVSWIYSGV